MKKIVSVGFVLMMAVIVSGCNLKTMLSSNKDIGEAAAKAKVEEFIKGSLVPDGTEVNIKSSAKENGLYKIVLGIKAKGQTAEQEITSYLTTDGTKFFPDAMDIETVTKQAADAKSKAGGAQADASGQPAQKEIPKTDAPTVDLYVMAFCPYGNQSEDTMKMVYDLLKSKVKFNFHYIVSVSGDTVQSLHGEKEVVEDEREACILKNYGKDKWMTFVTYVNANCGSDGSCWEAGATAQSISTDKINVCVNAEGVTLMKAEQDASTKAGANGSPTLVINGVTSQAVYQYGNSEAYKKAICDAFKTAPAECAKTLSAQTSTSAGGNCAPAAPTN